MSKKGLKRTMAVIISLFVVLIVISSQSDSALRIKEISFWYGFAFGGLFLSFVVNLRIYLKERENEKNEE